MILSLLLSPAFAADPLSACCTAAGSRACPVEWPVTGPGTTYIAEDGGVRATGLWKAGCYAGLRFDAGAATSFRTKPLDGATSLVVDGPGAACFDAVCALPPALCASWDGDVARIAGCRGPAPASAWTAEAVTDSAAVVVDRRVIRVVRQVSNGTATSSLDLSVPKAPAAGCRTAGALRDTSTSQVDAGDTAMLAGNVADGLARYRAAITLNACNAFAWVGLGQAFLEAGAPVPAAEALRVATTLLPSHYTAWTDLGRAEEALGHRREASSAYHAALVAKPDFGPAVEGYARTR